MMTSKEEANLILALNNYRYIGLNAELYRALMHTKYLPYFQYSNPVIGPQICMWFYSYDTNHPMYGFNTISVSNNCGTAFEKKWPPECKLEDFDKVIKLKEFW
jgi:hypothetical protein